MNENGNGDTGLNALYAAREDRDKAITYLQDQLAIQRRKREAILLAIETYRSTDQDLLQTIKDANKMLGVKSNSTIKRILVFDEAAVESQVVEMFQTSKTLTKAEIVRQLQSADTKFSDAGLVRILNTSPKINRIGERHKTRYELAKVATAGAE